MILNSQRSNISNNFSQRVNKLFFWYALFMAFPSIAIFQNISVYIFVLILFYLKSHGFTSFSYSKKLQRLALIFAFGAFVSSLGSFIIGGNDYLFRSIQVLPNYIYWSFLIIFLVHHCNRLNFNSIFKGISVGLVLSIIYFFSIQHSFIVDALPMFRKFSQNNFAFLLICFSPIVIYYVNIKFGKIPAFIFIILLSLAGLLCGSRSGSVLVFVGSFLVYFNTGKINFWRSTIIAIASISVILILSSDFGEKSIKTLNPRTHELIYNTISTFETDRSYLVRRALVEKGLDLFLQYPISGVGLNNFSYISGNIKGDFEGAEFIINKDLEQGKSAHNSYISILTEGGILLSLPFALILLSLIGYYIRRINKLPNYFKPVFIGVMMMAIHLYFISAILNVFGWFLIGLAAALVYRDKESRSQNSNLKESETSNYQILRK